MNPIALPKSSSASAIDPSIPNTRRAESRFDGTPRSTSNGKQPTGATSGNDSGGAATGRASDTVTLSPDARAAGPTSAVQGGPDTANADNDPRRDDTAVSTNPRGRDGEPLSDEETRQVQELKARDAEVRRHEQAHVAAGGRYVTSGPSYEYQQGPDGKRYAIGGSVGIDTSPEDTPEATITKAQTVRRAALAPAEPSSQDRRVAAQASQMEQQARADLAAERQAEARQDDEDDDKQAAENTGSVPAPANAQQLEQAYTDVPVTTPTFQTTA